MAIKKVSVIVPMHNGERFISRCIESILNQSYKKIELIIVDDNDNNSEDNTNPGIEDDDSLSLDDFISSDDQITSNDTVIDYDDSVSTDGTLNDSYTNETTNGSDAVTPDTALPDPNTDSMQSLSNEASADMLVESMASYPVEESGVAYTMHL